MSGSSNGFVDQTLDNGLRIVIEPMSTVQSAAAGFLVRTGARDETPELAGVSHFLEHMCFKGTAKRDWHQITIEFDEMGSTYNAYTSKERTFYFGWVRTEDLQRQMELLGDMMRSVIPPQEFETEKKVILEEIAMSADQMDSCIYDLIHERLYAGHSLAWPVLGTTETISALGRDQLFEYFEGRYHPANMVLIVAGAVDPEATLKMAERFCGAWKPKAPRPRRIEPPTITPAVHVRIADRFQQQALAIAYPAPSATHPDREDADVFAAILGGHNSRFFWKIIQAGLAPYVAAGRLDYCDAAIMIAFGFCEPDKAEALLEGMKQELSRATRDGVTRDEVQRVKNRTRTALTTEAEAPYYRLMQLVHDIDVLGGPRNVEERLAAVEAVTPDSILAYLKRWPIAGPGSLTSMGPRNWPDGSPFVL